MTAKTTSTINFERKQNAISGLSAFYTRLISFLKYYWLNSLQAVEIMEKPNQDHSVIKCNNKFIRAL